MSVAVERLVSVDRILEALRLFIAPGQVTELRALNVASGYGRPHTEAGFFDHQHLGVMAKEAARLTRSSTGVYFVMNLLTPDLLARRCNRVAVAESGSLAKDGDVLSRRWILIDCDPNRTEGVSATDAEKAVAGDVAKAVREGLAARSWPAPIFADSGNGWHLFYRVDISADDQDLVKRCLQALAKLYDSPAAKIDCKVFNPSRIVKLPGTLSRKGDDVPGRPHRISCLVDVPAELQVVPLAALQELAPLAPLPSRKPSSAVPSNGAGAGHTAARAKTGDVAARAIAYIAKLPDAISGQHGSDPTFHAARVLVWGFDLPVNEALSILQAYYNPRCQPPWSEAELLHKCQDADTKPFDKPRGWLRDAESKPTGSSGSQRTESKTLGNLTLRPGLACKSAAGKISMPLAVLRDGIAIDHAYLASSAHGRMAVVKQLAGHLVDMVEAPARGQIARLLGEILAEAAASLEQKAATDQKRLAGIVRSEVPAEWKFAYRTARGMWSEQRAADVNRVDFVTFTPNWLLDAAALAADAPRFAGGEINRPALLQAVKSELEVLWADLMAKMPTAPEADLSGDMAAAKRLRGALLRIWHTPGVNERVKVKDEVVVVNGSLASRVRSRIRETDSKQAAPKWRKIHAPFQAWWWRGPDDQGELITRLAMHFTLGGQFHVDLAGIGDHREFTRVAKQLGLIGEASGTWDSRFCVLSKELSEEILSDLEDEEMASGSPQKSTGPT